MEFWNDYSSSLMVAIPVLALLLMYLLRRQAHRLLEELARAAHRSLRLAARGCQRSAQRIRLRNHEVIKSLAEALMERQLERRFMRIERLVERDLDNYQKLSAQINRRLTEIGEDYEASSAVPEPQPEWIAAVEAIAGLDKEHRNNEVMSRILGDMHDTIKQHHREALREHRWTVSARHKVLAGLRPQWRRLAKLLEHMDHNIEILRQRLRQVDRHMGQFELLTAGSGQGIMSSMLMRFLIAFCFVALGTTAAWVNVQLLHDPLVAALAAPPLGDPALVGLVGVLHVGVILVAAAMITESLRVTHLLPLTGAMTRRGRSLMMWSGVGLLAAAVALEASVLLGAVITPDTPALGGLSSVVLALVSVIMPLMVAVAIIPLEYLLHTVRPVLGSAVQVVMHMSALALRLAAALAIDVGRVAVTLYDAVIILPLMMERAVRERRAQGQPQVAGDLDSSSDQAPAPNVTALQFGVGSSRKD